MHCLITLDCSTCRLKTEEPVSGIYAPFDNPMVLLDEVVEIFTLSQLSAVGEGSFFLQLLNRRRIGRILALLKSSPRNVARFACLSLRSMSRTNSIPGSSSIARRTWSVKATNGSSALLSNAHFRLIEMCNQIPPIIYLAVYGSAIVPNDCV
jgi:hypothetical protein